jgi:hypothetical protein
MFWDRVRQNRNTIMHSVSHKSFDPATLVRTLMTAAQALFAEVRWPQRLLDMQMEGKYAANGLGDAARDVVMQQIDIAVRHLTPAENRRFFGYEVKRRSYLCPNCYNRAEWRNLLPKLAQFASKSPGGRALHCVVCDETVEVERTACTNPNCQGDVIYEGMCLSCASSEDDPGGFRSGLADKDSGPGHRYHFVYERPQLQNV